MGGLLKRFQNLYANIFRAALLSDFHFPSDFFFFSVVFVAVGCGNNEVDDRGAGAWLKRD